MIKIEFRENQTNRHNNDVRLRRKMLTSSERIQSKKKHAYSNGVKEAFQKTINTEKNNLSNLTIGSHAIRKIDYTLSVFSKDFKFLEENKGLRRRLRPSAKHVSELKTV